MTAEQWAEVFRAGADAVPGTAILREEGLPAGVLYGAAALKRALDAMEAKALEIAGRPS